MGAARRKLQYRVDAIVRCSLRRKGTIEMTRLAPGVSALLVMGARAPNLQRNFQRAPILW
jgi:hypothetical protein